MSRIVPIAFAFDNNLVFPASVCISSLLMNAEEGTFYDIFIIHSQDVQLDKTGFDVLSEKYDNCRIQYKTIGRVFDNAFEIRDITTPTYYRLLIPELIPEYDKIIYSDVDMIFRTDLSSVYDTDMSDSYVAGTYDIDMNISVNGRKHIDETQGLVHGEYLQAGFIILNTKLMRENRLQSEFLKLAKNNYQFQDQDIMNIACAGKKTIIPWHYNMTTYSFYYLECEPDKIVGKYANSDIERARNHSNIHFNGAKPWKSYSINFDVWWEYYRKSPVFKSEYYFDFFYKKLTEYDQLTLWKRIKILARYFIHGRQK